MNSIAQPQTKKQVSASSGGFFWTDVTTTKCELRSNGKVTKFQAKVFKPMVFEPAKMNNDFIELMKIQSENTTKILETLSTLPLLKIQT